MSDWRLNNFKVIILWLTIALVKGVYGQDNTLLYGVVSDTAGIPVPFANITIQGTLMGTSTDENGRYRLNISGGKNFTLFVTCVGFESISVNLKLARNEARELDFRLTPAVSSIEEVSVLSSRRKFGNIEKISIKDIGFVPDVSGNFESILKSLPGVSSANELRSQYSVRGGNFDENLVYVNDIEVYRPFLIRSGQQEGLSFINPDMVSSVEFSAGGFNAEYGDKMSSVLNIKYRQPKGSGANVGINLLGANLTVENASRNGKLSHITGFRYKTSKYMLGTLDVQGDYNPSFIDCQTYLTYKPVTGLSFSILGNYSSNRYQLTPVVRETRFGVFNSAMQLKVYYEGQEVNRFETLLGALSVDYRPAEPLQLKFLASTFSTFERETFDVLGQYFLNELDNTLGSTTYGDSLINVGIGGFLNHARNFLTANVYSAEHLGCLTVKENRLKWGVKLQHERIDDLISEWDLIDSSGYSLPYLGDRVSLAYSLKAGNLLISNRFSGYVQDEFAVRGDLLNILTTLGTRFIYWDYNRELLVSPRATITVEPNRRNDLEFHLSTGVYNQPPFYKELRFKNGTLNPGIRSQQSVHLLVGTEYRFTAWQRPFKLVAEAYYKWFTNLIPYTIDNVRIRYSGENQARGYAQGIDLKVNGELVPGAESWLSLSVLKTREDIANDSYIDASGKTIYPGYYPRPTDQLLNLGLYFQDYLPGNPTFRVHLSGHSGTGLPFGMPRSNRYDLVSRMPDYKRFDIGFSKVLKDDQGKGGSRLNNTTWIKSLRVSAEVFNLFNFNNTVSYLWVQTVGNQSNQSGTYAVPNYLTSRRLNLKLAMKF